MLSTTDHTDVATYLNQALLMASSPTFVRLTLSQAVGTSPLAITSTTINTNLNADLWDGFHISSAITLTNTTNSTTKDTGALILEGGLGVEKSIVAGGGLTATTGTFSSDVSVGTIDASNPLTICRYSAASPYAWIRSSVGGASSSGFIFRTINAGSWLTALQIEGNGGATFAGGLTATTGTFSSPVDVGNVGTSSYAKYGSNFMRAYQAGSFYIDHYAIGQYFVFRTSVISALDTIAIELSPYGSATFAGGLIVGSDASINRGTNINYLTLSGGTEIHTGASISLFGYNYGTDYGGSILARIGYYNGVPITNPFVNIYYWDNGTQNLIFHLDKIGALTLVGGLTVGSNILDDSDGVDNIGGATGYFNDISYKTLTDRGCLGDFSLGVEMPDGQVLSDLEALKAIQVDAKELTVYGVPRLKYSSMPKAVYKPIPEKAPDDSEWQVDAEGRKYWMEHRTKTHAETTKTYYVGDLAEMPPKTPDGKLWKQDDAGFYFEAEKTVEEEYFVKRVPAEGAEQSAFTSIMFGAIKETASKVESLEALISKMIGAIKEQADDINHLKQENAEIKKKLGIA